MSEEEKYTENASDDNSKKDEKIEIIAEIVADDLKDKTLETEWTAPFVGCDWQDNDFVLAMPKIKNVQMHMDVDNTDAIEYFDDYKNSNGMHIYCNTQFGQNDFVHPLNHFKFRGVH